MKTKLTILFFALMATMSYAQHPQSGENSNISLVSFKDAAFNDAYNKYIELKNSLVASKAEDAQHSASALQKVLTNIAGASNAAASAEKIAKSSDLKLQRLSFSDLSNEIAALAKKNKLTSGSIYLEYCPMANNNSGAVWLSNEKSIMNPYFGNAMLHCGSVTETIQ